MEENNCIIINAPMGAGAHQLGRLIATCNNVVWYNYKGNGTNPWNSYQEKDKNFTPYHFNRRFAGAVGKGVCENTIPPIGSKSNKTLKEQQAEISKWCNKLYPNMFVYPLHESVDLTRSIFKTKKEIFIIPTIDQLFERFMKTSYYYFASPNDKKITVGDLFSHNKDAIKEHLELKIHELKTNITKDVYVVNNVSKLLLQDNFEHLCKHFNLDFNFDSFTAVKNMIN